VRVRGSAGAGEVCQRRGDRMLRVWGAKRGGKVPLQISLPFLLHW